MKTIAVLLTVHNRKAKTLSCLNSLFNAERPKGVQIEVYLTNDGCTDGTPEVVKEQFPQVKIIEGDGSLFWNRGMYKAWKVASETKDYDYYLWLNDDVVLFDNAFTMLMDCINQKGSNAIYVGSTCSAVDNNITTYGGRKGSRVIPVNGEILEVECFNGNFVLVPRSVFKEVGLLDYRLQHSMGDVEYGYRAGKRSIKSYILPAHIGVCERHEQPKLWTDPRVNFAKRWKNLHSPAGLPPTQYYYYNLKYRGVVNAFYLFAMLYIRVLFPYLWKRY